MATPTRAKVRLGKYLAELRNRTGITLVMAAQQLKTSDGTISRYESGHVLPVWATVLTLLNLYEVSAKDRKIASDLWDSAHDEPPSIRLPGGTPKAFRRLVNAEREAPAARHIETSIIPGLLQTESYARALMASGRSIQLPDLKVDTVITNRLARQQRLIGADPLSLHVLLDEAAVVREVGGVDVLREQLAFLLVAAARPNIVLQIIPFGAGAYGSMAGSCVVLDYPFDETPGVYVEYPAGGAWVDNEDDVQRFTTMFDEVAKLALSPAKSTDLVRKRIKALENP
ncbi:putative DNA-binding protein [Alloactinosynnema sp. L-07]|uniref:helix-turn-helix domain-containing protein n=1 Tax=Alloactinosynnema sp. L-07 TaxID=1653480 RepID=UPI00065F0B8F|nr:helix-turn-helix transcriptional regulator [Alloactinosynnema sp. L-07]CRK61207.1 putative DNA-binding protein [Alloactinosynnema sp. L-07]